MTLKNITVLDLIEACEKPGCLVCTLRDEMVQSYIRMLFHEHINDPPSRDKLRNSYGLCFEHSWLAIDGQLGNALGHAILNLDVIEKLLKDLSGIQIEKGNSSILRSWIKPSRSENQASSWFKPNKECPVCQHHAYVEDWIIKTLVESIQKDELSAAIRASDGLCLPHLRQSLIRKASVEAKQTLLDLSREHWEKLQFELSEFIRKNDYRFSKEEVGEERDSWLRATGLLKGNRPNRKT
jgi:hypothetical protein